MTLQEKYLQVRAQIPPQVRLVVVSKNRSVADIRLLYELGQRDFGENRVQEALQKTTELTDLPDLNWHLLGSLQSNKISKALNIFSFIHSVDTLALAQQIAKQAEKLGKQPKILLQVKLLADPNKSGFTELELTQVLPLARALGGIEVIGLMTILPQGVVGAEARAVFERLGEVAGEHNLAELSMGMSADYLEAIEAGSTIVRVGRILFE